MAERIFNNARRICREIMIRIAKGAFNSTLAEIADRIPLEMRPSDKPVTRCCIYKDRAVIKYRCMASLGFAVENEEDELTTLAEYTDKVKAEGFTADRHLTLLDVACSSCPKAHYTISNTCRGCAARPCTIVCPKNAIAVVNGKASIDESLCINCGKCLSACPFNAVIRIPIPCEESCPVKAIYEDSEGRRIIDHDKCINCGKCIVACPFGAIMECSQVVSLIQALKSADKHVTALPAPALEGQFPASWAQLEKALLKLGFDDVIHVGFGAEKTIVHEAEELAHKLDSGQKLMTTSCCPAYVQFVDKHADNLKPFISDTPSPMLFAAQMAREKSNNTITVFIGPCLAKRQEARANGKVDMVISFEELGAMMVAAEIFPDEMPVDDVNMPSGPARGFAISSGVSAAVLGKYNGKEQVKAESVDGIDRKSAVKLKNALKLYDANFIEVMACEGGCVAGPGILMQPEKAAKQIRKAIEE